MGRLIAILFVLLGGVVALKAIGTIKEGIEVSASKRAVLSIRTDLSETPPHSANMADLPENPPNIVIILADDLGWRDVGYNGSEIQTPTIDQLAGAGITLHRFYVQPSCSPTRAALLTGKSPIRLGIFNPISKKNPSGLPLNERTLADRLKAIGYQTALTGKWHLGPRNLDHHPNARGFDHFYGNLTGGVGYYDKVHGGGYDWQRNGVTIREEGYTTELIAQEAVDFIKARDPDRPLFLYASFNAPHLPNEAPSAAVEPYRSIKKKQRQIHAAMVSELDRAIGRIHDTLVAEGIDRETLIWFLSDNGGLIAKNQLRHLPNPIFSKAVEARFSIKANPVFIDFVRTNLRDGGSDNRPFKGGKQSVSEGGVRVPSFVYWPGRIGPGDHNHMTTVQDIVPTLMEISKAPRDGTRFDGRPLWDALQSGSPGPAMDYIVQTSQLGQTFAIYRYPYKMIEHDKGQQLFNIEADPLEKRNIANKHSDLVDALSMSLKAFPRGTDIAIPLQNVVDDPDYFGGVEDRAPWADQAVAVHGND
ncbi:MAG: arylsulfatase [Pseudomonadota bacterium]